MTLQRALMRQDEGDDSSAAMFRPCEMETSRQDLLSKPVEPAAGGELEPDTTSVEHGNHFAALKEDMEDEMSSLELEVQRRVVLSTAIRISDASESPRKTLPKPPLSLTLNGRRTAAPGEPDQQQRASASSEQGDAIVQPHSSGDTEPEDTPRTASIRALLNKTAALTAASTRPTSASMWSDRAGWAPHSEEDDRDGLLGLGCGIETFDDLQKALTFELVRLLL